MKKTIIALLALSGIAMANQHTGSFTYTAPDDTTGVTGGYTFAFDNEWNDLSIEKLSSTHVQKNINEITLADDTKVTFNTAYTPGVNIGENSGVSWTLSFTLKNNTTESISLSEMNFGVFLFNGGGSAQTADTFERPITMTLAYAGGDNIGMVNVATKGGNGNNDWNPTVRFSLADFEVASKGEVNLTLTVTNAQTENFKGTYVGLSSVGVVPIPEPTTATLSLLALAGLAARRRRR